MSDLPKSTSDIQEVFNRVSASPAKKVINIAKTFLVIIFGTSIATLGLNNFVIPNELLDGGVVGLALLSQQVIGGDIGLWIGLLSIPFLAIGWFKVGKGFVIKSAFGIGLLIICVHFLPATPLTNEKVLASVFGGCFLGAGVGLTMRGSAVLDGTEILALILSKRSALAVGEIILIINIFIFTAAAVLLDVERALYSMLTYFCAAKMIEYVLHGFEAYNGITIISNQAETVRQQIIHETGRGVTIYKGKGGYTNEERQILFCVVTRLEVPAIKAVAQNIDPNAFIMVQTLNEASGGMFKRGSVH
jgi:uncharacterized membrane-anchored protein YitT (DUF2179 family)